MKKIIKITKFTSAILIAVSLTGCVSMGDIGVQSINSKKSGVIYGTLVSFGSEKVNEVCDAIKNTDKRCLSRDKYLAKMVVSSVGMSDGPIGIMALVDKDLQFTQTWHFGEGNTFVKAEKLNGQLGTILEIASEPGDNKCYWSGLRGQGGAVCPAYNWDYRKDGQVAIPSH